MRVAQLRQTVGHTRCTNLIYVVEATALPEEVVKTMLELPAKDFETQVHVRGGGLFNGMDGIERISWTARTD